MTVKLLKQERVEDTFVDFAPVGTVCNHEMGGSLGEAIDNIVIALFLKGGKEAPEVEVENLADEVPEGVVVLDEGAD